MKIRFEIKEQMPDIIANIMHSGKWQTNVLEDGERLKRVTIKDPDYDSEAYIEIWPNEIHIRTAWSKLHIPHLHVGRHRFV